MCPPVNYQVEWAREFRYDGARARYLNRELSPAGLLMNPQQFNSRSDTWTDYDGDEAYGDFTVSGSTATPMKSYEPGLAQVDPWRSSGSAATDYMMTDHLGTTRGVIDPNNVPTDAVVYTAFGERISGTNHRFGYVGSFGYQASGEYPFLHVGHRYLDPSTGRFLQRDPIGIVGGRNVYSYAEACPTCLMDPSGLWTIGIGFSGTVYFGCFHLQLEISFHIGHSSNSGWSAGFTGTGGGGIGVGAGVGFGPVATFTRAESVSKLGGKSTEIGVDTPLGSLSVIQGWPTNSDLPNSGYSGIQVGAVGPPMPILGLRAGDTNTIAPPCAPVTHR